MACWEEEEEGEEDGESHALLGSSPSGWDPLEGSVGVADIFWTEEGRLYMNALTGGVRRVRKIRLRNGASGAIELELLNCATEWLCNSVS